MAAKTKAEPTALKIRAEDAEDIAVIAACVQDAVVRKRDIGYVPRERRFALVLNRYCWECEAGARSGPGARRRSGLHFDGVLKVETRHFRALAPETPLELLTIVCETVADGEAILFLPFAGGTEIRLHVEAIDGYLADIGPAWKTASKPSHPVDENGQPRRNRR
jgi:hypothetical protein